MSKTIVFDTFLFITKICHFSYAQFAKNLSDPVLLPKFSCHSLRHTFTTRMVEAGVNIKVVQEVLGHKDVQVTLNIYTDVTKDLKKKEFKELNQKWKENIAGVESE